MPDIGDQSVNYGGTLRVPIEAQNATGPVTYSIDPPVDGAYIHPVTGHLYYVPGERVDNITVVATDYENTDSATMRVMVEDSIWVSISVHGSSTYTLGVGTAWRGDMIGGFRSLTGTTHTNNGFSNASTSISITTLSSWDSPAPNTIYYAEILLAGGDNLLSRDSNIYVQINPGRSGFEIIPNPNTRPYLVLPDIIRTAEADRQLVIEPEFADNDGNPTKITMVTNGTRGDARISGTTIIYTPHEGELGDDMINYTLTENRGVNATGAIGITIKNLVHPSFVVPPNTPGADAIVIHEGDEYSFNINVTNPDDIRYDLSVTLGDPAAENATIGEDGMFRWTPREEHGGANYNVTIHLAYNTDGTSTPLHTISKQIKLAVTETNQNPVFTTAQTELPATATIPFVYDLNATDADMPVQTVTYHILSQNPSQNPAEIDEMTGEITWTPAVAETRIITIQARDGHSPSGTANITLTVAVQDAPRLEISDVPDKNVNVFSTLRVPIETQNATGPVTYSIDPPVDGAYIHPVRGHLYYVPKDGQQGLQNITVTAFDSENSDNATIRVTVNEPTATITSIVRNGTTYTATFDAERGAVARFEAAGTNFYDSSNIIDVPSSTTGYKISFSVDSTHPRQNVIYYFTITDERFDFNPITTIYAQFVPGQDWFRIIPDPWSRQDHYVPDLNITTKTGRPRTVMPELSDNDGNNVTITEVTNGTKGMTTTDGMAVTYKSNPSVKGNDTITYKVTDNKGTSVTGTIMIRIEPLVAPSFDVPPNTPGADAIVIHERDEYSFNINVTNPDDISYALSVTPGDPEAEGAMIGQNGTFVWTPPEQQADSARYNVTITLTPEETEPFSRQITLAVTKTNQNPVFDDAIDTAPTTMVRELFNHTITATDTDIPEQAISYEIVSQDPSENPAGINETTGMIIWTPVTVEDRTITVRASDDHAPNGIAEITLTVTVLPAPVVATDDNVTGTGLDTLIIPVLENDITAAGPAIVNVTSNLAPEHDELFGTVTHTQTHLIYEPGSAATTLGIEGNYTYTVQGVDNNIDTADLIIYIEPPLAAVTVDVTAMPPNAIFDITTYAENIIGRILEGDDTVYTFAEIAAPAPGAIPASDSVTVGGLTGGTSYTYQFAKRADTSYAGNDIITANFTTMSRPIGLDSLTNQTIPEGAMLDYPIPAINPDGQAIAWAITSESLGANITAAGRFVWTPTEDHGGETYEFDFTAKATTNTVNGALSVSVTETNQNPVFVTTNTTLVATTGVPFEHDLHATDADIPDQTITYRIVSQNSTENPAVIDNRTGRITWMPVTAQNRIITVQASDDYTPNGTASITLNITVPNTAPTATDFDVIAALSRTAVIDLEDTSRISDPDQAVSTLGVAISQNATKGTTQIIGNIIFYTPDAGASGTDRIKYAVTDDKELTDTGTVTIRITNATEPPSGNLTLPDIPDQTVRAHSTLRLDVVAADTTGFTRYSLDPPVPGSHINSTTGHLIWVPSADQTGRQTLTVRATDITGSVTADIVVNVKDPIVTVDSITGHSDNQNRLEYTAGSEDINVVIRSPDAVIHRSELESGNNTTYLTTRIHSLDPEPDTIYHVEFHTDRNPLQSDNNVYVQFSTGQNGFAIMPNPYSARQNTPPAASDFDITAAPSRTIAIDLAARNLVHDAEQPSNTLFVRINNQFGLDQGSVSTRGTVLIYQTNDDATATDKISYTVTDSQGGIGHGLVYITIDESTQLPYPRQDNSIAPEVQVAASQNRPLPIEKLKDASSTTFHVQKGAVYFSDPDFIYDPFIDYAGIDTIYYRVLGTYGAITVYVNEPGNTPPQLDGVSDMSASKGQTLAFVASASDADGDKLAFGIANEPEGAAMTARGAFSWTPTALQAGSHTITITVHDGRGGADWQDIVIDVPYAAHAPKLPEITDPIIPELRQFDMRLAAIDEDNFPTELVFGQNGAPPGLAVSANRLIWTPTEEQGPKTYAFNVTVADGDNNIDSQEIALTVTEINQNPVFDAFNASHNVVAGDTFMLDLNARDADMPEQAISYHIISQNASDNLAVINDMANEISWTPNTVETRVITVQARDDFDPWGTANETLTIVAISRTPTAQNIEFELDAGQSVHRDIADIVHDPDGDSIKLDISRPPMMGHAKALNTTISYTANHNADGTDSFSYRITNNHGASSTWDAAAKIGPHAIDPTVNRNPVAPNIRIIIDQNDPLATIMPEPTDPDNDRINITSVTGAERGTLDSNLQLANTIFYRPQAGYYGIDTINYTVSDDSGAVDTGTITVYVKEMSNSNPSLNRIGAKAVNADDRLSFVVEASDNRHDSLIFGIDDAPKGATISPHGVFSWTPAMSQLGHHNITITVHDGRGGAIWQDVAVLVHPADTINSNPIAPDIAMTVAPDGILQITPSISDPDGNRAVILSATGATRGTIEDMFLSSGLVVYVPDQAGGTDTIIYTVSDGSGGTAVGTITVVIASSPVLGPLTNMSVTAHDTLRFRADAMDPNGDALNYTLSGHPRGASITGTGEFRWTPDGTQTGIHTFAVIVSDGSNTDRQNVTVTVVANVIDFPNRNPETPDNLRNTGHVVAPVSNTTVGSVLEAYMSRGLVVFAGSPAPGLDATRGNTSAGFLLAGIIINGTYAGLPGTGIADYDGIGPGDITVFISEIGNVPPTLSPVGDHTINAHGTLTFVVSAMDFNDTVSYRLSGAPAGAEISGEGVFRWTPRSADVNSHTFMITAYDGHGATDTESVTITVLPAGTPNESPTVPDVAATVSPEGRILIIPAISDPDEDPTRITGATGNAGGTIMPLDNSIEYIAGPVPGTETVIYTVTDSRGAMTTGTMTITIQ